VLSIGAAALGAFDVSQNLPSGAALSI